MGLSSRACYDLYVFCKVWPAVNAANFLFFSSSTQIFFFFSIPPALLQHAYISIGRDKDYESIEPYPHKSCSNDDGNTYWLHSILPALAFSLDMFEKTHQSYGVNEVLLASVLGAVVFSLFAAQPLVIVGVTGKFEEYVKACFIRADRGFF